MNLGSVLHGGHGRRIRVRRDAAMVAAVSVAMLGGIAVAATSASASEGKVWVCHATTSDTNPYRIINVSVNSTKLEGHRMHKDNPPHRWKSVGTFGGVNHTADQPKPDIIGEPGADSPPETCGEGVTANASLTLVKKVINSGVLPSEWLLHADATSGGTSFEGTSGTASATHEVADGTYTLSESKGPTIGYTNTGWACDNATANSSTVTIGDDDTDVTCTITNTYQRPETQMATLTLKKTVVNTGGGTALDTAWTLDAEGTTEGTSSFASGTTPVSHEVADGTYTLSETPSLANYSASTWDCTNTEVNRAFVVIGANDSDVTCTITNTYNPPRIVTRDAPAISLEKFATVNETDGDLVAQDGESITYTFRVTNTGNVALTAVTVIDALAGVGTVTCPATTLAVGASFTCTAAAFLVTTANATGSDIVNVATASGQPPTGSRVEATDTVDTPTGVVTGEVVTVEPVTAPVEVAEGAVVTVAPVVAPAKVTQLAFTGAETVPLGLSGLLALLLGAGLVATARRQGRRANN